MDRTIPYDPDETCDVCGNVGAYDFFGDYLCEECALEAIEEELDE